MEIQSEIKRFLLMVAAGVTTAIAVQFAIKYLEDRAILAARAEMQKLIMATLPQNNVETTPNNEFLTTASVAYCA